MCTRSCRCAHQDFAAAGLCRKADSSDAFLALDPPSESRTPTGAARKIYEYTPLGGVLINRQPNADLDVPHLPVSVYCKCVTALRASIRTFAAGPDDAGFWPVIRSSSLTVRTPQS